MTNWTELKRLAEEASWTGRWYDAGCNTVMCTYVDKDVSDHDEIAHPCPLGITGFIAAANPKTILALTAENERHRELATKFKEETDSLRAEVEALRKDALRWKCVRNAIPMQSPYAVWREGSHLVLGKDADELVDNFLADKDGSA